MQCGSFSEVSSDNCNKEIGRKEELILMFFDLHDTTVTCILSDCTGKIFGQFLNLTQHLVSQSFIWFLSYRV